MRKPLATVLLTVLLLAGLGAAGWLAGGGTRPVPVGGVSSAEDYPAGVRFVMVALGGFRGVLADLLWLRASQRQEEGDYFEAAQLTGWITRLEPRYPEVWSYHAWNIAYNIGVMFPDPADRWEWLMRGIRLLRDEGIAANPRSSRLYWDIGWMYYDKIGGRWEENPLDFRARLASEMTAVFGDGAAEPVWRGVAEVWRRAEGAGLRRDRIGEVESAYGPFDWRLPEAHTIYWAAGGRPFQDPDMRWCDRLIWTALADMVSGGRLYFDPVRRLYVQGPSLDLARRGVASYRKAGMAETPYTAVVAERFLDEAMITLYAFSDAAGAEKARVELSGLPGADKPAATVDAEVREELVRRLKEMPAARARQLLVSYLAREEIWRGLGDPQLAAGFRQLAVLHKEALARTLSAGAWSQLNADWSAIQEEGRLSAAAALAGKPL